MSSAEALGPMRSSRRILSSIGAAALWLLFLVAHATYNIKNDESVGAAFFVQLTLITYLFVRRNDAARVSTSSRDWIVGFVGGFGSFLLRPGGAESSLSTTVGLPLQVLGLLISTVALIELGRSFGIVAADRGIVGRGPYAVVRHPAYLGYAIAEIGYLFQSFSSVNLAIVVITWACQFERIRAEEKLLSDNPEYGEYKRKVRYALITGIW